MSSRPQDQLPNKVEHRNRLKRLEQMMLRGITNQHDIAAAFGVAQSSVSNWMKEVYTAWAEADAQDSIAERTVRVKQLEYILTQALNSYDISRRDAEEWEVTERPCESCGGSGKWLPKDSTETKPCRGCNGKGQIKSERTKSKAQAGDPTFLKVAKDCIVEAARLKGLYPVKMTVGRSLMQTSADAGGEFQKRVETLFFEAPVDLIIQAKAMLEELKTHAKPTTPPPGPVIEASDFPEKPT